MISLWSDPYYEAWFLIFVVARDFPATNRWDVDPDQHRPIEIMTVGVGRAHTMLAPEAGSD
jgi:hypothetical protein